MPEYIHRKILQHVADKRYQPRDADELAEELHIAPQEREMFRTALTQLAENGQVVIGSSDHVSLPPPGREVIGQFRGNERGFGFIVPDTKMEYGDLFVPEGKTLMAMTGDRVRARVVHEKGRAGVGRSPYTGRIVEIIQRSDRQYVGTLSQKGGHWIVSVDGKFMHEPVIIRDPHAKNAKAGDKVAIELIDYPTSEHMGEGVITEILGDAGEPDVETAATMKAYGLVEKFPQSVVDEARAASQKLSLDAVPEERVDLTNEFIITIDPPDAKDFDDAISIRRLGEGQGPGAKGQGENGDETSAKSLGPRPSTLGPFYELGVHIAHVSHYVTPGSELDKEAYKRGNSTYLPRKVVPMLPEVLSNGVCSLQEGVNRYCLSAFMTYDADGNVLSQRFARTVIKSAKRLTYLEAQALIDDDIKAARKETKTEPKYSSQLIQTLKLMDELAKVIRKRRFKQGMIVLALPDVELVFDDLGNVIDAKPEDDAFTHKVIEMFMVEANEATARLFDSLNVLMVRRIHPDPPAHDMSDLRSFARVAGYNIPANPTRKELQTLLTGVQGKPSQQAVHFAVLRTLSQAEYSPLLIGHFALASEHYTHFTSPIRRYPDLIVHRGLDAYLDALAKHRVQMTPGGRAKDKIAKDMAHDPRCPNEDRLNEMCRHCSGTERNSEAAERDLRTYLVLALLAEHLGDDYEGTVTGVTGSGIFVQLNRYLVDGFISVADISRSFGSVSDRFAYNRNTGGLVAQRSGKTIAIGHRFIVRVASVDTVRRKMDLVIVSEVHGSGAIVAPGTKDGGEGNAKPQAAGEKPFKRKQPNGAKKAHQETMAVKKSKKKKPFKLKSKPEKKRKW
ncbi:MAG: VacB/RNase II family 3'-5' exoribonuclease [Phycisphaeraceae bacterium]